jgi:hypothetical protein
MNAHVGKASDTRAENKCESAHELPLKKPGMKNRVIETATHKRAESPRSVQNAEIQFAEREAWYNERKKSGTPRMMPRIVI